MSVNLEVFAVDLLRFENLLHQSLIEVLWYFVDHSDASDTSPYNRLIFENHESIFPPSYQAIPGKGVARISENSRTEIARNANPPDSFSQMTLGEYFARNTSYELNISFIGLHRCSPDPIVRKLLSGGYRWWVGSFLHGVESAPQITPNQYKRLETLFRRILGGYDCGKALNAPPKVYEDLPFPVLPKEDADLEMGAWSSKETDFQLEIIRGITKARALQFRKPPLSTSLSAMVDEEWNEWVYDVLENLLRVGSFPDSEWGIVSFIGD